MRFLFYSTLAATFLFGHAAFAQDTAGTGTIRGSVRYMDGKAAEGVRVCLENSDRCATSAADGLFRITDLRPGTYRLSLGALTTSGVEVRAGLDARVEIDMPRVEATAQSITVSEPIFVAPEEIKTSAYITPGREIFQNAGALQDVSRFVQTLPGVAIGADDFRNDIIVRGGSPLENLFIVDNIEVPNINTFANFGSAGGTVGILDSALIEDTNFLTGGYPAPFINRTSSVLQITQREGDRENFHGRATLGFAGVGTILEGPIKKGKGSWVVSARRSFLDLFTKDLGFGGVPKTYTFNGKALYDLTSRDRIWVASLAAVDSIRLGATQDGDNDEEINNLDIRYSGWRNATGFNWQRLYGSRGVGLLGVTYSTATVDQAVRDLVRNGVPPPDTNVDELIARSPVVFSEDSREGEATLKYDHTIYGESIGKLQFGGNYKRFQIRYNTASPFGSDSPYSLQRDLNPVDLRRSFGANQTGAYVQATRNLGRRLNLTYGGRVDRYAYLDSARFSPRAGLSYRLTERLSWRASFGSYYQQPNFLFLAAFPQNRGAVPFRADHYVTGLTYTLSQTVRFSAEVYRKNYKDYPVALQFPTLSLANLGDTFNVRDLLFPLTSAGRGRAQGVELFLEKRLTSKFYAQANLSMSSAKQAGLDGVLRPAAFDYRRIFNVTGGYRFNDKWELATRISYLGGRPFTPFALAESQAQRRGIFDLNQVNGDRLKDYARVDFRVDRVLTAWGKPLRVFAGAQNILGRENIAGYIWNRRTNGVQVNEQIGVFPLIGLDWRF